jgi:hypothetical protein
VAVARRLPNVAQACDSCIAASASNVQWAFIDASIFLSVTPLAVVGAWSGGSSDARRSLPKTSRRPALPAPLPRDSPPVAARARIAASRSSPSARLAAGGATFVGHGTVESVDRDQRRPSLPTRSPA